MTAVALEYKRDAFDVPRSHTTPALKEFSGPRELCCVEKPFREFSKPGAMLCISGSAPARVESSGPCQWKQCSLINDLP
jgi:hypothetical protein